MKINENKTRVMVVEKNEEIINKGMNKKAIEKIESFKYFGVNLRRKDQENEVIV